MKCIRCGRDSKYKERPSRKCPYCGGAFAFEPQAGDHLTDPAFKTAIDAVSAVGRVRWGVEHLYYEVCRRWNRHYRKYWHVGLGMTAVCGVLLFFFPLGAAWKVVAIALAGISTFFLYKRSRQPELVANDQFNSLWARWNQAYDQPKGIIMRQPLAPPARAKEADLGDYSFDRAVICDRARTVDLLLANNFHFEHNCAVLSIEGYPPGPFETVRAMLQRNPRLQVFALHDATPTGCKMAFRLAHDREWFKDRVLVTDVGLRPFHAKPFMRLCLPPGSGMVSAGEGLTAEEAEWLSLYSLELAVIRPEQVLKRLFNAMTRKKDDGGSGGDGGGGSSDGGVVLDSDSFSGQGGEFGGGGADDSFG